MLVIISGPSGAGKTTICRALVNRLPDVTLSVSATTRPRRPNEIDGDAYWFISPGEFQRRIDEGRFLEWAEYLGNRYGTPIEPVHAAFAQGRVVLLEIEVQGGVQVKRARPDAIGIFILPPTMDSLKARLAGRDTESERQMQQRLAEADGEIGFARDCGGYAYFVVNDEVDRTVKEIIAIIQKERSRT
jgi:guanylate kinase